MFTSVVRNFYVLTSDARVWNYQRVVVVFLLLLAVCCYG